MLKEEGVLFSEDVCLTDVPAEFESMTCDGLECANSMVVNVLLMYWPNCAGY